MSVATVYHRNFLLRHMKTLNLYATQLPVYEYFTNVYFLSQTPPTVAPTSPVILRSYGANQKVSFAKPEAQTKQTTAYSQGVSVNVSVPSGSEVPVVPIRVPVHLDTPAKAYKPLPPEPVNVVISPKIELSSDRTLVTSPSVMTPLRVETNSSGIPVPPPQPPKPSKLSPPSNVFYVQGRAKTVRIGKVLTTTVIYMNNVTQAQHVQHKT